MELYFCLGRYKYPFCFCIFESVLGLVASDSNLILDAGCGPNSPILRLQKYALAVALDIKRSNLEKMANECSRRGLSKMSLIMASVNNLPFRENVFDVIAMRDVLEHVGDMDGTMQQMAYSMKNGAKILITTTNILNPIMLCDSILPAVVSQKIASRFGISYYERKTRPSPLTLLQIVKRNSMIAIYLSMFSIPPFVTLKKLSIYEHDFPNIYYLWIAFEKLTNTTITKIFKEIIFVIAEKTSS